MKKNEILRITGTDYRGMTRRLLAEAGLAGLIPKGARIGIKPNLVTPSPADYGATTHPEIVAAIIEYLQANGFSDITVMEGSWVGDKTSEAFKICGYTALAKTCGVKLLDTQKDGSFTADCAGLSLKLCRCVRDVDFLINVPVLKGHCQTKMTCALKNMKGLIPNSEKRRFHSMGLHKPIAHLNAAIRQDFIVVDHICGDLSFEEGGNPVRRDCIFVSRDPVLTDAYVCSLLRLSPDDVPYIRYAEALRIGSADLSAAGIRALDETEKDADESASLPESALLDVRYAVDEVDSCSACYASLVPALLQLQKEGLLALLKDKIAIGQGHQNRTGEIGIGACCSHFRHVIPGCPPKTEAIYEGLKKLISG